jgi:hypothetical protein
VVEYCIANRSLDNVTEIGVDEISVFNWPKFLTMVYQLNAGARRLLCCGPDRRVKTLLSSKLFKFGLLFSNYKTSRRQIIGNLL